MIRAVPILLNVADRVVVIVGGGPVALRKAQTMVQAGASQVHAVSRAFTGDWPDAVRRRTGDYTASQLDGAGLVLACTDNPQTNRQVVADARARGILAGRADSDDPEAGDHGDFTLPACHRDGGLTVCVSAAGSPAIAKAVRQRIADSLDPRWGRLAELAGELRPAVLRSGLDAPTRAAALRDLASDDAAATAVAHGLPGLRAWLAGRYPQLGWEAGS